LPEHWDVSLTPLAQVPEGRSPSNAKAGCGGLRLSIRETEAEQNSRPIGLRIALMTLRLLEHWRTHLGIDHDAALIVLATAAITMEKFTRQSFDPELRDIRSAMPSELLTRCNVSSIAAATGLNRETTRRKVQSLLDAGILIANPKSSIRLCPDYTRDVVTSDLLRSQLQTVVQAANGLVKEGIVDVAPESSTA
jgi:hypothetical protein